MDTNWKSTAEREYYAAPQKLGLRAWAGSLAFFLGVSLVLGSLGCMASQRLWERDLLPWGETDWQETQNFRDEVSARLRDFLVLGAGGTPSQYAGREEYYWQERDAVVSEGGGWLPSTWLIIGQETTNDAAYVESVPMDRGSGDGAVPKAADADYQDDKNVYYLIEGGSGTEKRSYTNAPAGFFQSSADESFNFYLTFENGKASILKDGRSVDVYGAGVYTEESQWFLPGYSNFPAGDQLSDVKVRMAIRKTPVPYYTMDCSYGGTSCGSSFYYLFQRLEENQWFWQVQAGLLGCGVLLLGLWRCLRKSARLAAGRIAWRTRCVWTEVRLAAVLLCALWAFLPGLGSTNFFWAVVYGSWEDIWYGILPNGAAELFRLLLGNLPGLLALFWLLWLIHNDHRYNPKESRRSLLRPFLRGLRARELKRPVEKRLSRRSAWFVLAMVVLGAEILFFLVFLTTRLRAEVIWMLWTLFLLPLLGAVWAALAMGHRELGLARDLGRLADHVKAVRAGDLSTPLDLPEDTDLRQTAEDLNDIQSGMRAALEEQTRSERMKVELVSNVSHDLKTPLTSILSYAELLRQEDLSPAAADYARVIDEKAQRLKVMVEDVFEVSKAAADQLPVHLERLDLAKLLRQTLADMDGSIRASALTFKVDLPQEPVLITADGKRLYRVFQNLIDNALRYALEGSRVYLTLKTAGKTAEASVRNTSRSELPEGVDFTARFVRGDASRTDGGSGLGLSIASSFTEACGGTFRVETVADLFTVAVTFQTVE